MSALVGVLVGVLLGAAVTLCAVAAVLWLADHAPSQRADGE